MDYEFLEVYDENGEAMLISVDTLMESDTPKETRKDGKPKKKYNEWIESEGQYFPAKDTKIRLNIQPGYYSIAIANNQYSALREEIDTDALYNLPNNIISLVVDEIDKFWDKKDLFAQNEVVHKRGIMLYGRPGCGKTSIINILTQKVVERGGLVFHIKSVNDLRSYLDFVHLYLRVVEPSTPIITVIEDIDNLVHQDESGLLNFLDGDDQFDHNVIIATTNRIHETNDLLIRPSRFDWVIEVPPPLDEVREFFFRKKGIPEDQLKTWVSKSKDMSMAQLKEMFIAVVLLDNDLDAVVTKLKEQEKAAGQSTYVPKRSTTGFR